MKKNIILVIDFDSTFVSVESLDELAKIVLDKRVNKKRILNQIITITQQGMEGKITFPESLSRRFKLFKPEAKHIKKLIKFLHTAVTPSVMRNKKFFQENARQIYILSGGFKEYMMPVLRDYGIHEDHILSNLFVFNKENKIAGYYKENLLAKEKGKVKMIQKMNFNKPVIMIGDGYTDYEIKEAGLSQKFIAFVENVKREIVIKNADHIAKNFEEVIAFL